MMKNDVNLDESCLNVLVNGIYYIPWSIVVTLSLGGKKKLGFH